MCKPAVMRAFFLAKKAAMVVAASIEKNRVDCSMTLNDFVAERYYDARGILCAFVSEAVAAAASIGVGVGADEILVAADGKWKTCAETKKKGGKHASSFVLSYKQSKGGISYPCITFKNYKHGGSTIFWSSYSHLLQAHEDEKGSGAQIKKPSATAREEYERRQRIFAEEQARKATEWAAIEVEMLAAAAAAARLMVAEARPAVGSEPYIQKKQIPAFLFDGIYVAQKTLSARLYSRTEEKWIDTVICSAGDIIIPMRNASGEIVNAQRIKPDGTKRPVTGGAITGVFFDIPGVLPWVACEGVATGCSVAQISGRAVRVCFTAVNIRAVIEATGDDVKLIAADNDVVLHADGSIDEEKSSKTGEKIAEATGLPFAMPPIIGGQKTDWNDFLCAFDGCYTTHVADVFEKSIRVAVAEKTLARPNEWPPRQAFNAYKIIPYTLKGSNVWTWINALDAEENPDVACSMAWAICARRAKMIPVVHSAAQLVDAVCQGCAAITEDMRAGILARLQSWTDKRKSRALESVSMPPSALIRHAHEVVSELPTLTPDDYRGVIIVRAPMAAGKTQKIGAPFTMWAKQQAGRFVATCHRRSLVSEMATRLGVTHYSEVTAEIAHAVGAIATCLPSITKAAHAPIYASCRWLFIDEVAQVLRFLEARDVCSTEDGTNADVYKKLKELIRQAECVIVADAGCDARTLRFIEECRPTNERFRIIEMTPQPQKLEVAAGVGTAAQSKAFGEMLARCEAGENIWIGCESEKRVAVVARWLRQAGVKTLALTGENKGDAEQLAFWENPELESLKYQAVVHSPVISSGLSIEHSDHGAHFDHGFFIGGGLAVTPADAAQMMRRVRYLKTWTMTLLNNNSAGISDADSLLDGMEDAAIVEGHAPRATTFDELCAGIKAGDAASRADFCAGLWWILEAAGFHVRADDVGADDESAAGIKTVREEETIERMTAILEAHDISDDEARTLKNSEARTQYESHALERWRIKHGLGCADVTPEEYQLWDEGRVVSKLDRYSAAVWGIVDEHDAADEHLSRRRWWIARRSAYQYIFEGIALGEGAEITRDDAVTIIERVIRKRFMLAFLGVVPAKYAETARVSADGDELAMTMPAYPMRDVVAILERMGVKAADKSKRGTYTVGGFDATGALAARRNAVRLAKPAQAPAVAVVESEPAPRARKATKRDALKAQALKLAEVGMSLRAIGAELGIGLSTVQRWFKL